MNAPFLIRLKGYHPSHNRLTDPAGRYKTAKEPIQGVSWKKSPLTPEGAEKWRQEGGWVGWAVPDGRIVVDIDDEPTGEAVYLALKKEKVKFAAIKTPNGYQFLFQDAGTVEKQQVKYLTVSGIVADFRLANKGYIVEPSVGTVPPSADPDARRWLVQPEGELDPMPLHFKPLKRADENAFPVPMKEGGRNASFLEHACRLRAFGIDGEELEEAIEWSNRHLTECPLPDEEIQKLLINAKSYQAGGSGAKKKTAQQKTEREESSSRTQAVRLAELAEAGGAVLFHPPAENEPYAHIPIGNHKETYALRSKAFRLWLQRAAHLEGISAREQTLQDALRLLEAKAVFDGAEEAVHLRTAFHEGSIYLDLANSDWQAVEIAASGWKVVDNPPVRFRREKGMQALPLPVPGGNLDALRKYLNFHEDEDFQLMIAWLLAALHPDTSRIQYPILVFNAQQGSGKTTTARILRMLTDPNSTPLRNEPREERDFWISAKKGWVLAFDNLSRVPAWFSDALCRVSTGGGYSTRELYSDDEETLFAAKRPVILNGIGDRLTRSDALDRSILASLPPLPDEKRIPESELWEAFEKERPLLLGALCEAVSVALKNRPSVKLDSYPRLADFTIWVSAAEPALGWEEGAFLNAYVGNREDAHRIALESSGFGEVLEAFLEGQFKQSGEWEGTAQTLLDALKGFVDTDEKKHQKSCLPKAANALSGTLKRFAPNLLGVGIGVEFKTVKEQGITRKLIILKKQAQKTVPIVTVDDPGSKSGFDPGSDTSSGIETEIAPFSESAFERKYSNGSDASDGSDDCAPFWGMNKSELLEMIRGFYVKARGSEDGWQMNREILESYSIEELRQKYLYWKRQAEGG